MKSIFLVILLLIELTFSSGGIVNEAESIKEKTTEDIVSRVGSFISLLQARNDQIKDCSENLKGKDKIISDIDEELKKKDQVIKGLEDHIRSVSEELSEITDQLLTTNGTDRCPIGSESGIYRVKIPGLRNFEAACNEEGWMTIQRRIDGSENFTRDWESYKNGFGDVRKEFFIGLEKLYQMTDQRHCELKIILGDANGTTKYAYYDDFRIGNEEASYEITHLSSFNGTAGDSMHWNQYKKFSTFDRDNDLIPEDCAGTHSGGWWFAECGYSSLNGKYHADGFAPDYNGIHWGTAHGYNYRVSLLSTEMMIRPKIYNN
ncbi:fibroleukin-like [Drosophila subpulchrella]|uniref:fibroleukin-like n=1 Tax=Drosophila subpulchrella TaxID=1486046 RepID=UPI0018A1464C|nr:fibroleukin-like [Drosophila subpulchrella]